LDIEIPMLSSFFPKLNLTESSNELDGIKNGNKQYLTNISKNIHTEKTKDKTSDFILTNTSFGEKMEGKTEVLY
jgi:hypothetical protein